MATTKRTRFSRRLPDHVTDELVAALTKKKIYEFNSLFEAVYENLKLRNAVSGGEEMLRLRAYEKLQNLVNGGMVTKSADKKYRGRPAALLVVSSRLEEWRVAAKQRTPALRAG